MASNDEGQGSGDCDDVYQAADEFFSLADDQPMLLLGPPVDSMSYTTFWSTDGITRTFACHLDPVMPIFCNGQKT